MNTYNEDEGMDSDKLVSKRRKQMAEWAADNFKTWPKPFEIIDANPEEIGCELIVLNQYHLPVLRCRMGGGFVGSLDWFYARKTKKQV